MHELLEQLLNQIIEAGRSKGLDQQAIVERAGLGATRLSKAKRADDIRLSTLVRMANAVGLRIALVPNDPRLERLQSRNLFGPGPVAGAEQEH